MTHKFPLDVRRNYTIRRSTKDGYRGWLVKCDTCGLEFTPGSTVEPANLQLLRHHIQQHIGIPTQELYTVIVFQFGAGDKTMVLHSLPDDRAWELDQVQSAPESPDTYMVVVRAANRKHAHLKGYNLIKQYLIPPTHQRRHWRFNP